MKNIFENVLFGVAREDYKIEASLIEKNNYKNLLTVCSGGCVPLSLKAIFPDLNVVAYDINSNQIDHCKKKTNAVLRKDFPSLNINQYGDQLSLRLLHLTPILILKLRAQLGAGDQNLD